ncbi:MAG: nuclear transport factor 2 family protein [Candidatus Binatia bacterium]|nr:nuclear transport factor 2 family protein [Candidatus Binatia bacterium]
MAKSNSDLMRENLAGFDRFDYEFVASGYADDGVLHFVQRKPIQGRAEILAFFTRQFEPITNTRIEIKNVVESGNLVMVERIDHYEYKGIPISCPVANAAEFGDGKIKVWREYFDQQFAVKLVQKGMESRKQGG